MKFKVSALKSKSGMTIRPENIEIRRVLCKNNNPRRYTGNMLVVPKLVKMNSGQAVWLWIMLYAPGGCVPGLYKGKLDITGNAHNLSVPINLRVLSFSLPALKNNAGFYIPAHFYFKDKKQRYNDYKCIIKDWYGNVAFPGFNAANVDNYFMFWKTRKLNSPVLAHIYNDLILSSNDQVDIVDYSDLNRIMASIKKAKLNGLIGIDGTFLRNWAFLLGNKINKKQAEAKQDKTYVSLVGKKIFIEGLKATINIGKKEGWPKFRQIVGEEISNQKWKSGRFHNYINDICANIDPNDIMILDNDIGRRPEAVDRGRVYNLKHRQYASWTEKALEDAARDKAEVWTYNHGPYRSTFGFFQLRIGSHGHHQWVDQWKGHRFDWFYSIITDKGKMISSTEFERIHEGRNDLAFYRKLENTIKAKGGVASAKASETLKDVLLDIPVPKDKYLTWRRKQTENELDTRRWSLAAQIVSLTDSKNTLLKATAIGSPKAYINYSSTDEVDKENGLLTIRAKKNDKNFNLDGKELEGIWGRGTGLLKCTLNKERGIRAYCATEEEVKKKLRNPSASKAWVSYNSKGLCLLLRRDHAMLADKYAVRENNDPELWLDNSMECFFKVPGQKNYYRLIINAKGKKALIQNGKVIADRAEKIQIKTIKPKWGAPVHEHREQEALIPWEVFGLQHAPEKGSVWQMNIARTNYTLKVSQSWARVNEKYNEQDKWGALVFAGENDNKFLKKLSYSVGMPGDNIVSGILQLPPNTPVGKMSIEILDNNGKTVSSIKAQNGAFKINYYLSIENNFSENWKLALLDNNQEVESVGIPLLIPKRALKAKLLNKSVISGDNVKILMDILLSPLTAAKAKLQLEAKKSGEALSLPAVKLHKGGTCFIWINTSGMSPGEWELSFYLKGIKLKSKPEKLKIKILPFPYL